MATGESPNETATRGLRAHAHAHDDTDGSTRPKRVSDWRIVRKEGGRSSSVEMAGQASVGSIRGSIAEISVTTYFGGDRSAAGGKRALILMLIREAATLVCSAVREPAEWRCSLTIARKQ